MSNDNTLLLAGVGLLALYLYSTRERESANQPTYTVQPVTTFPGLSPGGSCPSPVPSTSPQPIPIDESNPALDFIHSSPLGPIATVIEDMIHRYQATQPTAYERGVRVLISDTGAFYYNEITGMCYGLDGRPITCPKDVIGISSGTYNYLIGAQK